MLNKLESKIMVYLCKECFDKNALLISPMDMLKIIGDKNLNKSKLEKIMQDLSVDGYFDLVYSDRQGELIYCITLTEKGKGYIRNSKMVKRNLIFRLCVTIVLAIVSFIVGIILKAIF